MTMSKSSSTGVWNSSSRGWVSRISISAFSLWLPGGKAGAREDRLDLAAQDRDLASGCAW